MAIDLISPEHYAALLDRLSALPADDPRVRALETELHAGMVQYHRLLLELEATLRDFVETSRKVRELDG